MRTMTTNLCGSLVVLAATAQAGLLSGADLADFAVYSRQNVNMHWQAKAWGDVAAWDRVTLDSQAKVFGDVFAGNDVTLGWQAKADATHDSLGVDAFNALGLPALDLAASGAADVTIGDQASLALTPGTYGDLSMNWKGALALSAGTYYFDSLYLGDQSRITLDTSAGDVLINVAGDTSMQWKADVQRTGGGGAMFTTGGTFNMASEVHFDASLLAGGNVDLDWQSHIAGQVFAYGNVDVADQVKIHGADLVAPATASPGAPIPEPSALALIIAGLVWMRRKV